jgi:hypothetical protein
MAACEPLKSKLYRYFFFGWMLQSPDGDVFLSAAQRRNNRHLARKWLPHYLRVHAVTTALCFGVVLAFSVLEVDPWELILSAIAGCLELGVTVITAAALGTLMLVEAHGDLDLD